MLAYASSGVQRLEKSVFRVPAPIERSALSYRQSAANGEPGDLRRQAAQKSLGSVTHALAGFESLLGDLFRHGGRSQTFGIAALKYFKQSIANTFNFTAALIYW